MLDIRYEHGMWKGYDWYLLSDGISSEYIFYAPTLRLALMLTNNLGSSISSNSVLPDQLLAKLETQSEHPAFPIIERPKAFHLAIGLTNNCTLACDYCHAEADRDTKINHELVSQAIDYAFLEAAKTPKKKMSVSFAVGGEPTMNWKEFTYTVDSIRDLEKQRYRGVEKVYLSMTTNCYYGKEKREYVARNFDTLTLSLDGDEEIQNLHRPTRAGNGSYALVAETCIFYIASNEVKAGIRGTVSSRSVSKLVEIVEHYHSKFGSGYTVAFEPLIRIGRALTGEIQPPTNEDFALNYWAARECGKDLGIRVITSAANIDRLVGRYCGAMSIPSFTVCTNGKVTACHRDQDGADYVYGEIETATRTVRIDENRVEKNIAQTQMPTYCAGCFAKWHCAGDCPDIRRIGYSRCDINRFVVYKQLHELLSKGGEPRAACHRLSEPKYANHYAKGGCKCVMISDDCLGCVLQ